MSRCLVTMAQFEREPWWSGSQALAKVAEIAGWDFHCEDDLQGERPWQAKRFAVRTAFAAFSEDPPDRVCWCDSDVLVRRPVTLACLLNQSGPAGIWCERMVNVRMELDRQAIRNGDTPEGRDRMHVVRRLWGDTCAGMLGRELDFFPMDWLVLYAIPRDVGLRICDVWDAIAAHLQRDGVTWTDGLSIGLAAAVCGVEFRHLWKPSAIRRSLVHLLSSRNSGAYTEGGKCSP